MNITVTNFNAWYNNSQILHDLNLTFPSKTLSAIIGPSGCGKTTLLQAINRTAELSPGFSCRGNIQLETDSLYANNDVSNVRRSIGMVFQRPIVLPFSIKENVMFGPRFFGIGNKNELTRLTENLLTQVGLWSEVKDKLDRPAKELSGGQQQRLSIARVLAVQPKVLLLDEPCSSLDILSTRLIEELLSKLTKQYTIVLVTHNLAQAKRIADHTFFMSGGHIVEHGITEKFFASPNKAETQEFLAMQ